MRESHYGGIPKLYHIFQGEVSSLQPYGAFIRIPGCRKQGLVHKSQMSTAHVDDPAEMLAKGEKVYCKVIAMESGGEKISLSMKVVNQKTGRDLDPNNVQLSQDEKKRRQWNFKGQNKIELGAELNTTCRRCGGHGHLAMDCFAGKGDNQYAFIPEPNTDLPSSDEDQRRRDKKKRKKEKKDKAKKKKKVRKHSSASESEASDDSDSDHKQRMKSRKDSSGKITNKHDHSRSKKERYSSHEDENDVTEKMGGGKKYHYTDTHASKSLKQRENYRESESESEDSLDGKKDREKGRKEESEKPTFGPFNEKERLRKREREASGSDSEDDQPRDKRERRSEDYRRGNYREDGRQPGYERGYKAYPVSAREKGHWRTDSRGGEEGDRNYEDDRDKRKNGRRNESYSRDFTNPGWKESTAQRPDKSNWGQNRHYNDGDGNFRRYGGYDGKYRGDRSSTNDRERRDMMRGNQYFKNPNRRGGGGGGYYRKDDRDDDDDFRSRRAGDDDYDDGNRQESSRKQVLEKRFRSGAAESGRRTNTPPPQTKRSGEASRRRDSSSGSDSDDERHERRKEHERKKRSHRSSSSSSSSSSSRS